jgi:hypothetical protein
MHEDLANGLLAYNTNRDILRLTDRWTHQQTEGRGP